LLKVKPASLAFLTAICINSGFAGRLTGFASHLPPLNSAAYSRFIKEQLLGKPAGPSLAQIGITMPVPSAANIAITAPGRGSLWTKDHHQTARQLGRWAWSGWV
jgi:hypothetical protein